jgi:hypothetical protein
LNQAIADEEKKKAAAKEANIKLENEASAAADALKAKQAPPAPPAPEKDERLKKFEATVKEIEDAKAAKEEAEEKRQAAIVPNPALKETEAKADAFAAEQKAKMEAEIKDLQKEGEKAAATVGKPLGGACKDLEGSDHTANLDVCSPQFFNVQTKAEESDSDSESDDE